MEGCHCPPPHKGMKKLRVVDDVEEKKVKSFSRPPNIQNTATSRAAVVTFLFPMPGHAKTSRERVKEKEKKTDRQLVPVPT